MQAEISDADSDMFDPAAVDEAHAINLPVFGPITKNVTDPVANRILGPITSVREDQPSGAMSVYCRVHVCATILPLKRDPSNAGVLACFAKAHACETKASHKALLNSFANP